MFFPWFSIVFPRFSHENPPFLQLAANLGMPWAAQTDRPRFDAARCGRPTELEENVKDFTSETWGMVDLATQKSGKKQFRCSINNSYNVRPPR